MRSLLLALLFLPIELLAQQRPTLRPVVDTSGEFRGALAVPISEWCDSSFGVWGFKDAAGNWAITPRFADAWEFRNGRALVTVADSNGYQLHGVIDERGEWLVPPVLSPIAEQSHQAFHNSYMFTYGRVGAFFCYHRSSDGRISPAILDFSDFLHEWYSYPDSNSSGMSWLQLPDSQRTPDDRLLYCIVDSNWHVVAWDIEAIQDRDFSRGRNPAMIGGRWGLIDERGDWVIEPRYRALGAWHKPWHSPRIRVLDSAGFHYVDSTGVTCIPGPFDIATDWPGDHAVVGIEDNNEFIYGIIDTLGRWVQPLVFDEIDPIGSPGYAALKKGRWLLLDGAGQRIGDMDFDTTPVAIDDLLLVKQHGCWGAINWTGEVILPLDSEAPVRIYDTTDGDPVEYFASFKQQGRWGIRTSSGRIIVSPTFDDEPRQWWLSRPVIQLDDSKHAWLIDASGRTIFPPILDEIHDLVATDEGEIRYVIGVSNDTCAYVDMRDLSKRVRPLLLDRIDDPLTTDDGNLRYVVGVLGDSTSYIDMRDPLKRVRPFLVNLYQLSTPNTRHFFDIAEPHMGSYAQRWGTEVDLRPDLSFHLEPDTLVLDGHFAADYTSAEGVHLTSDGRSDPFRMQLIAQVALHERPNNVYFHQPWLVTAGPSTPIFQSDIYRRIDSGVALLERLPQRDEESGMKVHARVLRSEIVYLDSARIAYDLTSFRKIDMWAGGPIECKYHRHNAVNLLIDRHGVREIGWRDLFRDDVDLSTLAYCPELGIVKSGAAPNASCKLYTLGSGAFLLEANALRVVYNEADYDDHDTEGYIIPYDLLRPYMKPEMVARLLGTEH